MLTDQTRYALYFTPAPQSALARFGASAIGYEVYDGSHVTHLKLNHFAPEELHLLTSEARRYGFHATLKAPFRLAPHADIATLEQKLKTFAASHPVVNSGTLTVSTIGNFIALVPDEQSPALTLFAAECVSAFDCYRAESNNEELKRRNKAALSQRENYLLEEWGYPYVFEKFRFHMTLSNSLDDQAKKTLLQQELSSHFVKLGTVALTIDAITLLEQPYPGAPFTVRSRFAFGA